MKTTPPSLVRAARALALQFLSEAARVEGSIEIDEKIHAAGMRLVLTVVSDDEVVVGPEEGDEQSVNTRMMELLAENREAAYGWSVQQWAERLGCTKAAIHKTRMWKAIMEYREKNRRDREENQGEI